MPASFPPLVGLDDGHRLRMPDPLARLLVLVRKDDALAGECLAFNDGRVGRDDERVLSLGRVEELAVAAVACGLCAAGATVPLVEPDDDPDDPCDADYAA